MNLLMITGKGGVELALGKKGAFYNTLEEFRKHWNRIDIICPKGASAISTPFDNVYVHSSPWSLLLQPLFILIKGKEIYLKEKFERFTVHDYPPFYNGIGAMLLNFKIKAPYMYEIFHIPGYPRASSFKEWVYKWLTRIFVRFVSQGASVIRVMNKKQVPDFLASAGVNRDKMRYIPAIYIDRDVFKPMHLGKEFDVIFVGRLEKNKGVFILLNALKSLPNVSAIIVGAGPLASQVSEFVESNKLATRIKVHGWAKDDKEVAELINKSRVLVAPSFNEGGPRVVLEALACGISVVATPVGVVEDLVGANVGIVDYSSESIRSGILGAINQSISSPINLFESRYVAIGRVANELKKL